MVEGLMFGRRQTIVAFVAMMVLVSGCTSSTPSMLDAKSAQSGRISHLWWLMFGLGVVVYLGVVAIVVVSMLRRRRGDDGDADEAAVDLTPSGRSDRSFLVYGGLVLPLVVLLVVAVQTVRVSNALRAAPATVHVAVDAYDWWWKVTYPDDGVVTANEIHVPIGEPVDIALQSDNVIHSLWVPQLNGKSDVIPGQTNHMSFTADVVGTFRGECAEFCGIQHTKMGFIVVVDSQRGSP
jgi:cytochrome c oxidase subunit II